MNTEKEISIDLIYLFKKLWSKKLIILATAILFASVSIAYSTFFIKPVYHSTTKIYTVNNYESKKNLTVQDFYIGSSLVNDYQEIILSKDVLSEVIEKENLEYSAGYLVSKISVSAPKDTRVVQITVADNNPELAKNITNTLKDVSVDKIKEITKIKNVTTIEEAVAATYPSSPNIKNNGLLAFIFGLGLSIGLIALKELLDDRVRRPEDVEEVMELTLLGIIPDTKKGLK